MSITDTMEKYLTDKDKYKENNESEDGSGNGQGIPNAKGRKSFRVCPHCGMNIDLRR